jgi:polar amino acid transport system substrate-binding protein
MASVLQGAFLSTAATRQWDWRIAIMIALVSIVGLALAVPYADYRWSVTPSFIAAYEAAMLVCDLITAALLIGQFRHVRSVGVLIVGCGYLFDAIIIAMHALSFPDVFSATGLLGASRQTTPWLYVMWHGIFPLFVCAYGLVARSRWNAPLQEHQAGTAIVIGIGGALGVAAVCTLLASTGVHWLPEIIRGNDYKRVVTSGIAPAAWLVSGVALALLWVKTRGRTVLDLWLMVVMVAWLLDILLSTAHQHGEIRFRLVCRTGLRADGRKFCPRRALARSEPSLWTPGSLPRRSPGQECGTRATDCRACQRA